jgi:hypothetical protein
VADGLGLAGAGGPGDEGVPVEAVQGQVQRPGRAQVPVEYHPDPHPGRVAAGEGGGFGGDVEGGAGDQPHAGDLHLRGPGQRGDQRRAGQAAGLAVGEQRGEVAGGPGGGQRVGQAGQVDPGAQQPGDRGGGLPVGAGGEQAHPPQPGRLAGP